MKKLKKYIFFTYGSKNQKNRYLQIKYYFKKIGKFYQNNLFFPDFCYFIMRYLRFPDRNKGAAALLQQPLWFCYRIRESFFILLKFIFS